LDRFGWRLELITTITRLMRIPLLALFFVSAMAFTLERALIDLVLMTGALMSLLWGGRKTGPALANEGIDLWKYFVLPLPMQRTAHPAPKSSHAEKRTGSSRREY
jgi:hypothetical protein